MGRECIPKEYKGMSQWTMLKKASIKHSDNGRCWWILNWIRIPPNGIVYQPKSRKKELIF
tara:strand:+ start:783 stop:962 length:180 start_codon:yes stop_codon:yes gene_type:complete